jgi:thiamine biosynthesis lipoprotein
MHEALKRVMGIVLVILPALAFLVPVFCGATPSRVEVARQVYLMGTRCTFVHYAGRRDEGLRQIEAFIRIVEDTEQQLSTWRTDSLFSRLNRHPVGVPFQLDPALCHLFGQLYFWQRETEATFDPAIGLLIKAWGLREGGRRPSSRVLAAARERSGMEHLRFDASSCRVMRNGEVTLDEGAFGKGEALDRIHQHAEAHGVFEWLIDLGGQVMVSGHPPASSAWEVPLAHPIRRDQALLTVGLTKGSLATSGGSERDLQTAGGHIDHILDPRTGQPVPMNGSVTVWHDSALVADICSTALYVMGPEKGRAWAEARNLAACYFLSHNNDVEILASRAFRARFGVNGSTSQGKPAKRCS